MKKQIAKKMLALVMVAAVLPTVTPTTKAHAQGKNVLEMTEFDQHMFQYLGNLTPAKATILELQIDNDSMYIDGEKQSVDTISDAKPMVRNGRTLAPVVSIVEGLGGTLSYKNETREVTIDYEDTEIVFHLDDTAVTTTTAGKTVISNLEVAPTIVEGRTMLPVSYLAEALTCSVEWVEDENVVVINNEYATKRLLVWVNEGDLSKYEQEGVEIFQSGGGLFVVQCSTTNQCKNLLDQMEADPAILSAEVDSVVSLESYKQGTSFSRAKASEEATQNKSGVSTTASSSNHISWGSERTSLDLMNTYLTANNTGGSITVAVLDTGVDSDHPFLSGRLLSGGYNVFNGGSDTEDYEGHGTSVSGVIVDNTPSSVKIYPVKTLDDSGSGTDLGIVTAIKQAAAQNVDVMNMSLGGNGRSTSVEIAINAAVAQGIVVVVAAGNYTIDTYYFYPAHVNDAIVVSSVNSSDQLSYFSNYGSTVDLSAPGESIYTSARGGGYTYIDGTSFSAPYVAAAAACVLLDNPSFAPSQVETVLRNTTDDRGTSGYDQYYGQGILNFEHYLNGYDVPTVDEPTTTPTPDEPTTTPTPDEPTTTPDTPNYDWDTDWDTDLDNNYGDIEWGSGWDSNLENDTWQYDHSYSYDSDSWSYSDNGTYYEFGGSLDDFNYSVGQRQNLPTGIISLRVGETYDCGNTTGLQETYSSMGAQFASVSSNGIVKANQVGSTIINIHGTWGSHSFIVQVV
ncbi:MAG: S8 family serine peptidase [Bacillota bacterium]